jgi:hypothetical protein
MRDQYFYSEGSIYSSAFKGAKLGFIHPHLSFGDYDRSCHIERSNVRVFLDMFKEEQGKYYEVVYGAYGSTSLFFYTDDEDFECISIDNEHHDGINEVLDALDDYPVINEDDCSAMEHEMIEESKEMFVDDFRRAWEQKYGDRFDIYNIDEDDAWAIIHRRAERRNEYFRIESGGNVWIDIDKLI